MDSDLEGERAAFIAGEVGEAVIELVIGGKEINRDNVVEHLEAKRKAVGNMIHKGVLRDGEAREVDTKKPGCAAGL